jgi:hypothetical protein
MYPAVNLLQLNSKMRAVGVFLILLIATANMSVAKVFSKCQFLKELEGHKVARNDLATCELIIIYMLLSTVIGLLSISLEFLR